VSESWDQTVFERLYADNNDPWNFHGSAYEREKYAHTLAALGDRNFSDALEIGCSIGVFTRLFAARCTHLLALDGSAKALHLARQHCNELSHVSFIQAQVPAQWPAGTFDVQVFSEILYFLSVADLCALAAKAVAALAPGGQILLVNWTGETNTPTTGNQAADIFIQATGLQTLLARQADSYRLDVLRAV
jgi:2-polyprenyl-3-methyl-5-hydroxy-6-metoxy-1,4-benzoquinol methylase